ncbi:hypothetical protein ACIBI3_02275 [Actinomadura luteofluorescens]|uniref:hypothetical protein n=1 Tax=Actinomadura luteofluorescens TaxID=46163 RepID=UPI003479B004
MSQTPDLTPLQTAARELGENLLAAFRTAWARIEPAVTYPTRDDYALVPGPDTFETAALNWLTARSAFRACLDGDDQAAARLLDDLDAAQLYAIEGAGSGLAIHASRLRKTLAEGEQQAAGEVNGETLEHARIRADLAGAYAARQHERADQAEDRLRKAEQAYTQLASVADDAVAARDRWRTRAEQAETDRAQLAARNRALDGQIAEERRARLTAEAANRRVRALCSRGPGPANEFQIWTVDVLAALDADQPKEPS